MPKITQVDRNPFFYSDTNKRYFTYDYYLKRTFGSKVAKITLDAGFTCPNIDGKCAVGGCIYCSGRGSGDFAGDPLDTITHQISEGIGKIATKWNTDKIIPYFQAHTNTYAPLSVLKPLFEEALAYNGVVGLNIATRADCLENDVVDYLAELSERTVLTVELGLQSASDKTALLINRGHDYAAFVDGYRRLRQRAPKVGICVHIIHGLPGETREDMLDTARKVAALHPDQVKIHLLHVIEGTVLGDMYHRGEYSPMDRDDYISCVCDSIELLPPDTVIARLTGDGAPDTLLAPMWSKKKVTVINDIDKELFKRGSYQGIYYKE